MYRLFYALLLAIMLTTLSVSTASANLVFNGDFESGNIGFTSAYGYQAGGTPPDLAGGLYAIGSNPNTYHQAFNNMAAQGGSGNMMIVNGAPISGVNVWAKSGIAVQQNTTYYFSAWSASVYPLSAAILNFSINGNSIGSMSPTLDGSWKQFYVSWYSGANTTVDLALVNMNTNPTGNDFALDTLALNTSAPIGAANVTTPEPGTMMLMGSGVLGMLGFRRRELLAYFRK